MLDLTPVRVRQTPGQNGFSLLETLVAIVVLSLSLGALYQAATGATRNARVAVEYNDALILAQSMLDDHRVLVDPGLSASGRWEEMNWSVRAFPLDGQPEQSENGEFPSGPALHALSVQVSWGDPGRERSLELNSIVPLQVIEPQL